MFIIGKIHSIHVDPPVSLHMYSYLYSMIHNRYPRIMCLLNAQVAFCERFWKPMLLNSTNDMNVLVKSNVYLLLRQCMITLWQALIIYQCYWFDYNWNLVYSNWISIEKFKIYLSLVVSFINLQLNLRTILHLKDQFNRTSLHRKSIVFMDFILT